MPYYPVTRARTGLTGWKPKGGLNPLSLFAGGEKGGLWLPENSDVAVGNGVGTVTDTTMNAKNLTQATNKPIRRTNATTGFDYLEFDGVNDGMQTATIDMTGTDAVTVFAVVRKRADTTTGTICEFTNNVNNFSLFGPSSNATPNYGFRSRGATGGAVNAVAGYAAPHSAVITAYGDISADTNIIRVNGVASANNATDQGTGNFANAALFVGSRDNGSLFAPMDLYMLLVIGRLLTADEITSLEAFGNARVRAF